MDAWVLIVVLLLAMAYLLARKQMNYRVLAIGIAVGLIVSTFLAIVFAASALR